MDMDVSDASVAKAMHQMMLQMKGTAQKANTHRHRALQRRREDFEDKMAQAQKEDPTLTVACEMFTYLNTMNEKTIAARIDDETTKRHRFEGIPPIALPDELLLRYASECYDIIQGYRRGDVTFDQRNGLMRYLGRIIVPLANRHRLTRLIHENDGTSHPGARLTYLKATNFFWKRMEKDISDFVKSCHTCQSGKRLTYKPAADNMGATTSIPQERLRCWSFDVIHLPTSSGPHGKKFLLVLVDAATGYPELIPLTKCDGQSIANHLAYEFFPRYLYNLTLICDQGRENMNKKVQDVVANYSSFLHYSTSYHSEGNPVERLNLVIGNLLRMLLQEKRLPKEKWPSLIPRVLTTLRAIPDVNTRDSPYFRAYGQRPFNEFEARTGIIEKNMHHAPRTKDIPNEYHVMTSAPWRINTTFQPCPHERIVEDTKDFLIIETSTDGNNWDRRLYQKFTAREPGAIKPSIECLLEITQADIFMTEMFARPDPDVIKAASNRFEETRHRRHAANLRQRRCNQLWWPKIGQIVDWISPIDPHSTHHKKLARKHRGCFRVLNMRHPRTAEVQGLDLDNMTLHGKIIAISINALRPSTVALAHLRNRDGTSTWDKLVGPPCPHEHHKRYRHQSPQPGTSRSRSPPPSASSRTEEETDPVHIFFNL